MWNVNSRNVTIPSFLKSGDNMDICYLGASKRYSEAVVANGLVFLSGMVPENPEADAKAQTENVLAQIDSWLAQCQSDKATF